MLFDSVLKLSIFVIWIFSLVLLKFYMQVREQGQQKGEVSPYLAELLRLEDQAKQQGLGRWSKVTIWMLGFTLTNMICFLSTNPH